MKGASNMQTLQDQRIVVTGGSRGLGLGIVEALVARGANVTVVARDTERLAAVKQRLGVGIAAGDIADAALAERVVREIRPNVLILNAGAIPPAGLLHTLSWEAFSKVWNTDVQAGFHWIQAALALPLPRGSRVVLGSSGAAIAGSPMSGGYAGAKRTLWLMAGYANVSAEELGLGIKFQALVPRQIIGETDLGRAAAEAYAKRKGVPVEAFLASFGPPMPPAKVGEHVVTLLTDPAYEAGVAFGVKGDLGLHALDS
jgi:NAD(P)-dependent dehydrogenase (short-subunit alcohol dehydrogenase family)